MRGRSTAPSDRLSQDNQSHSRCGAVHGIYFQALTRPGQARALRPRTVWEVVVDLRRESETSSEWEAAVLDDVHGHQLWIPVGFGHLRPVTVRSGRSADLTNLHAEAELAPGSIGGEDGMTQPARQRQARPVGGGQAGVPGERTQTRRLERIFDEQWLHFDDGAEHPASSQPVEDLSRIRPSIGEVAEHLGEVGTREHRAADHGFGHALLTAFPAQQREQGRRV